MTDIWARFNELDASMQARLAGVLETRGADAQQQSMRHAFLDQIPFAPQAAVLEVGCGTGVLTRLIARLPDVAEVIGTDPAPALLERARELAADDSKVRFQQADGRCLPFEAETFDSVVFDSVLSHMPSPELALTEAFVEEGGFRLVLTALKTGARLREHRTPGWVSIHAMTGHLRVRTAGCEMDLAAGHVLVLARDEPHEVEALEESAFLLTVAGFDRRT